MRKPKWEPKIEHIEYLQSSSVFEGLEVVRRMMGNSGKNYTWGDNDLSLVTAKRLLLLLGDLNEDSEFAANIKLVEEAKCRLKLLGSSYVDMEN